MRVVVTTILILVLFFVSTFMLNEYINKSCENLLANAKVLDKSIKGESWNQGTEEVKNLKEQWETTKKGWQLFLEHYEMDAIDIALSRLEEYIKIENKPLALGEMAELKLLISHVKDKESFKLVNIL